MKITWQENSKSQAKRIKVVVEAELLEQIALEIEDFAWSDARRSLQVQDACNIERYSYRRAAKIARGE